MRTPTATYRIQFNPRFGFRSAGEIVPYLSRLGISDIYASPVFHAKKGSEHGYDVVDPTRLNPELGSERDFELLTAERIDHHMGWLQDIVPNHMAFSHENRILMDLLESGRSSVFHNFFDIDWDHPGMDGKVLAPFLGKFYGESLEGGEIRLGIDPEGLAVHYFDHRFPLRIDSYGDLLTHQLEEF
jgi:(1->4)-alpha-D-glucan 1-alpha-D-glucosylmutase